MLILPATRPNLTNCILSSQEIEILKQGQSLSVPLDASQRGGKLIVAVAKVPHSVVIKGEGEGDILIILSEEGFERFLQEHITMFTAVQPQFCFMAGQPLGLFEKLDQNVIKRGYRMPEIKPLEEAEIDGSKVGELDDVADYLREGKIPNNAKRTSNTGRPPLTPKQPLQGLSPMGEQARPVNRLSGPPSPFAGMPTLGDLFLTMGPTPPMSISQFIQMIAETQAAQMEQVPYFADPFFKEMLGDDEMDEMLGMGVEEDSVTSGDLLDYLSDLVSHCDCRRCRKLAVLLPIFAALLNDIEDILEEDGGAIHMESAYLTDPLPFAAAAKQFPLHEILGSAILQDSGQHPYDKVVRVLVVRTKGPTHPIGISPFHN